MQRIDRYHLNNTIGNPVEHSIYSLDHKGTIRGSLAISFGYASVDQWPASEA